MQVIDAVASSIKSLDIPATWCAELPEALPELSRLILRCPAVKERFELSTPPESPVDIRKVINYRNLKELAFYGLLPPALSSTSKLLSCGDQNKPDNDDAAALVSTLDQLETLDVRLVAEYHNIKNETFHRITPILDLLCPRLPLLQRLGGMMVSDLALISIARNASQIPERHLNVILASFTNSNISILVDLLSKIDAKFALQLLPTIYGTNAWRFAVLADWLNRKTDHEAAGGHAILLDFFLDNAHLHRDEKVIVSLVVIAMQHFDGSRQLELLDVLTGFYRKAAPRADSNSYALKPLHELAVSSLLHYTPESLPLLSTRYLKL
jgi:hypothetical protein